jgi:hypothetical protein
MIDRVAWLEARSEGAPAALRHRVRLYFDSNSPGGGLPEDLAAAAMRALEVTMHADGSRATALDLLAADALVTMALQAKAELDPAGLAGFARWLRDAGARRRD